jgi:hypothetical protein
MIEEPLRCLARRGGRKFAFRFEKAEARRLLSDKTNVPCRDETNVPLSRIVPLRSVPCAEGVRHFSPYSAFAIANKNSQDPVGKVLNLSLYLVALMLLKAVATL